MITTRPDLLAGLSDDHTAAVIALARRRMLASGETLFRLGMDAEALYVIDRGRIALTLPMQFGQAHQDILIEERAPGQMLGWSALIPPHRFTLNASAPLPTEVLAFRRAALLEYFAAHPEVGYTVAMNVAAIVGQRLQVFQAMWLREMQRTVNVVHA
jgi:CRP/FNR family transcriptional regulator, cyclic AMP receptor protein